MSGEPRVYSTLTHRKEPLPVGRDGVVRIYVCGPTVYGPVHIGNARPFVVFMVFKRYLERRGVRVRLASNLTDVNDKIYAAAAEAGVASDDLARRMGRAYIEDTDRLGLGRPDDEPTVTESMPAIIAMIERLVESGLAYPADGDVYFRVRGFPGYGALSGRRVDELEPQEPGEGKEDPLDFALWKGAKEGEDTSWDSPWGPGRPGWHIECSAMARAALGEGIEIHGGGIDLVFPHHENEIAQSEGAGAAPFARVWMHNDMLELGGDKMSKSEGNIALLRDVLDRWPADVVKTFFLTSHYRSRLPFTEERMAQAAARAERIRNAVRTLDGAIVAAPSGPPRGEPADSTRAARVAFFQALDDDFNTPAAFAAIDDLVSAANRAVEAGVAAAQLRELRRELLGLLDVLGLAGLAEAPPPEVPAEVRELLERRERARAARDFAEADAARAEIQRRGFKLRDTPQGPQVYPA